MARSDDTAKGLIVESMPNTQYRVETPDGDIVRAYLSGKMKKFRINVLVGDKVEYVVDRLGDNNRIIKRL